MKKQWLWRGGIYAVGIFTLALGATLGTKTRLGISPITSAPFAISSAFGLSLSTGVFVFYSILIALEFLIRGKHRRWRDLLQLPFSFVFSALMGVFEKALPMCGEPIWQRLLVLMVAIVLTGVGIAMVVNMQLVPNPPDGMVQAVSWATKKDMGLCKNAMDLFCVSVAFLIDLLFGTLWTSVGVGTVIFSLLCGRVVSVFNRCCREKMESLAGLKE